MPPTQGKQEQAKKKLRSEIRCIQQETRRSVHISSLSLIWLETERHFPNNNNNNNNTNNSLWRRPLGFVRSGSGVVSSFSLAGVGVNQYVVDTHTHTLIIIITTTALCYYYYQLLLILQITIHYYILAVIIIIIEYY